jgi:RNA 2',3'-cyclic 3'-phosphodiesterase
MTGDDASPATPDASPAAPDDRPWRLFVALSLPDAVRAALAVPGDGTWRPVAPDSLHLTLAFLGARPPADVEPISRVLEAEAGTPAPRLALGGPLMLPPRRPRVLAVALEDLDGTLGPLQARVSQGLAEAGVYTPEKRPFRAHITVARLRPQARAPRAIDGPERLELTAAELTLYRSQLHPKGARYTPVTSVLLAP